MRTVIIATLTLEQLEYVKNLANEQNITAEFISEGIVTEEEVHPEPTTPITGEILEAVAAQRGVTVIDVAKAASNWGINTVEEALAHTEVPRDLKEVLENYV